MFAVDCLVVRVVVIPGLPEKLNELQFLLCMVFLVALDSESVFVRELLS